MNDDPTHTAPHARAHTKRGQVRRVGGAPSLSVADHAPSPSQTPAHVPGQAIRLRGEKRRRGAR